jgi:hypothetical protein
MASSSHCLECHARLAEAVLPVSRLESHMLPDSRDSCVALLRCADMARKPKARGQVREHHFVLNSSCVIGHKPKMRSVRACAAGLRQTGSKNGALASSLRGTLPEERQWMSAQRYARLVRAGWGGQGKLCGALLYERLLARGFLRTTKVSHD